MQTKMASLLDFLAHKNAVRQLKGYNCFGVLNRHRESHLAMSNYIHVLWKHYDINVIRSVHALNKIFH